MHHGPACSSHWPALRHLPATLLLAGIFCWQGALHAEHESRRSPVVLAVHRARPSVVNINGEKTLSDTDAGPLGEKSRRVNGMGTGVIIDERGYIITNFHVVDGVRQIQVTTADQETYLARLVSHDPKTDLAIIKIDAEAPLPVIDLGTSRDLMTGETVIAVGNAYGYEHTVTLGIISALHRSVQVSETQRYDDLIQTDASINPGNSGGPLLNIDGQMVGINVAVRAGAQGIGFAIPVDKVLSVAAELLSTRRVKNLWHGVVARWDERGNQPAVVVASLEENSPASAAGLQPGDVIRAVDHQHVAHPLDLERALLGQQAGDAVKLEVLRGGEQLSLNLVLASPPRPRRLTPAEQVWEVLGLRLEPMPAQQFRQLRSRYHGGLRVVEVRPDSPAAEQGMKRGDVLVGMHIWETLSLENVAYVLNRPDLKSLLPLKFYVMRGTKPLYGYFELEAGK